MCVRNRSRAERTRGSSSFASPDCAEETALLMVPWALHKKFVRKEKRATCSFAVVFTCNLPARLGASSCQLCLIGPSSKGPTRMVRATSLRSCIHLKSCKRTAVKVEIFLSRSCWCSCNSHWALERTFGRYVWRTRGAVRCEASRYRQPPPAFGGSPLLPPVQAAQVRFAACCGRA